MAAGWTVSEERQLRQGRLVACPVRGNAGPARSEPVQSGETPHWILTVCMAVIGRPGLCGGQLVKSECHQSLAFLGSLLSLAGGWVP